MRKGRKTLSKCILGIEQTCDECRMCNPKEIQVNPELEQEYKEWTMAIKESGMPLPIQKYIQRLVDQDYINKCCTGAIDK